MMLVNTSSRYTTIGMESVTEISTSWKRGDHTWRGSLKAHTGVLVQRTVVSCPTMSHQIETGQIEQRHDDGCGHDDARNSARSVSSLNEVA